MTLVVILALAALALLYRLALRGRGQVWFLLVVSAGVMFWLQPITSIRYLDFWLPLLTLALTVTAWLVTTPREARALRTWLPALGVLLGALALIEITRFAGLGDIFGGHHPPPLEQLLPMLLGLALLGALLAWLPQGKSTWVLFGILLLFFIIIKTPALAQVASLGLRAANSQALDLAEGADLRWLGYSYVAFRLLHTLRDRQNGRLPAVSLQEYVVYAIFFPSFTAGPIDRLERFSKDLRAPLPFNDALLGQAGIRLVVGLFKKFALADTLALVALSPLNAQHTQSTAWLWLLLLAYSLQIYFDFSGYTDIAIGLGLLLGIRLPENFNHPYLKPNLTQFWNNWHMTLTQWFRAYFFNPLTRTLRKRWPRLPNALTVFLLQTATMLLIGLWHGVTVNFVVWGLWHGVGLFANNRWSEWSRPRLAALFEHPVAGRAYTAAATLLTFVYVSLGWVWFCLPDPSSALRVFSHLFGA